MKNSTKDYLKSLTTKRIGTKHEALFNDAIQNNLFNFGVMLIFNSADYLSLQIMLEEIGHIRDVKAENEEIKIYIDNHYFIFK